MNKYFCTLLFLLALTCNITNSYFYKLSIWNNGEQKLFLFSDLHVESSSCNKQRYDILNWAKKLNATVIVEDNYVTQELRKDPINYDRNKQILSRMQLLNLPSLTPLFGLTSLCYFAGISVENIEFRINFFSLLYGYPNSSVIMENSNKIIKEIETYNDCKEFNQIYKDTLNKYYTVLENRKALFDYLNKSNKSLKDFTSSTLDNSDINIKNFAAEMRQIIKEFGFKKSEKSIKRAKDSINNFLALFDMYLLDVRILHSIYKHKDKNIIVAAGGRHIDNLNNFFTALGYKKNYSSCEKSLEDYNIWLSQEEDKITFEIKIEPIDIDSLLNQVIKKNYAYSDTYLNSCLLMLKTRAKIDSYKLTSILRSSTFKYSLLVGYCLSLGFASGFILGQSWREHHTANNIA
jgi:hypothetical protein